MMSRSVVCKSLRPKDLPAKLCRKIFWRAIKWRDRAGYMFGAFLPKGPEGHIGSGLGQGISLGRSGLIPPTHQVTHTGETLTVDGIKMIFQMTPGAEAPQEFMFLLASV